MRFPWFGNVLVTAIEEFGPRREDLDGIAPVRPSMIYPLQTDLDSYRDMTMTDFRHIVDNLSVYRYNDQDGDDLGNPSLWSSWARKLTGVRVQGSTLSNMTFTTYTYPQDHPFWTDPLANLAGKALDLPLRYYDMASQQPGVMDIHMQVFATAFIPEMNHNRFRIDCHFVREDERDLLPEHLQAIFGFLADVIGVYPGQDREDVKKRVAEQLTERIKWRDLASYWEKHKEKNGWTGLPSPYQQM